MKILKRDREVSWERKTGNLVVEDLTYEEAQDLMKLLQNLDQMRDAVEKMQEMMDNIKTPSAVEKPAPYVGRPAPPPGVELAPGESLTLVDEEEYENRLDPHLTPEVRAARQKRDEGRQVAVPVETEIPPPPAEDALIHKIIEEGEAPEITTEDHSRLAELAEEVKEASEEVEAKRPGMDPSNVLDYYRDKKQSPKGSMTRREAREQFTYKEGDNYKGRSVIQAAVEETAHGEVWCLTLDNGDSVLVSMTGTELEYYQAEEEPTEATVPPTAEEERGAHDEMEHEGDAPDVPQDVLDNRKINKLLQYVIANDANHAGGVDFALLVEQMWSLQGSAKSLAAAKTKDKVERRVVSAMATLGIEVKSA